MRALRLLLEAARNPGGPAPEELSPELVGEARDKLGPLLQSWQGEILFGHYGAMRGLNTMADVDALVTIGDPWPNLADARNDAAFLGLEQKWEERLEAMCRAELEQAHGRLRAVHRTRPGRALHIGTVLPSGYGWTSGSVEFRAMKPGPGQEHSAMALLELSEGVKTLGGIRAAARVLGCSRSALARYCSGTRPVPPALAITLRAAMQTL